MTLPPEFQWIEDAGLAKIPCKIRCPSCFQKLDLSLFPPFSVTSCPACGAEVTVPVSFGGYELFKLLGQGRNCLIYQARDGILQRDIALKICFNQAEHEYYRAEFERLARMAHPGVLWIFTAQDYEQFTFGALQLMQAGSLRESRRLRESFGVEKLLASLIPVADALRLAKERRVVHRDICPDNLLCDGDGAIRLTNFRPGEEAEWPLPTDNWRYRSPEALSAQVFDEAGDMYSLTLSIYELFSGSFPFGQLTNVQTLVDRQQRPLRPLNELNPFISPALAAAIDGGLDPAPGARPTPAALVKELRTALAAILEKYQ